MGASEPCKNHPNQNDHGVCSGCHADTARRCEELEEIASGEHSQRLVLDESREAQRDINDVLKGRITALLTENKLLRDVQQWAPACDCMQCEYCLAVDALAKHCNPELLDANDEWRKAREDENA